jgi:ribokinase
MKHDRPTLCVVGSSNIDLTFRTARLPQPGETLMGQSFQFGCGGKGANQAVMAARQGARVTMIGKVGRDVFGELLLRNFRDEAIDTTRVGIADELASGVASIVVDDQARNCIIMVPGANGGLTAREVRAAAAAIEMVDVLIGQLEVPLDATLEAFRIARAAGVKTILNPAPAGPLSDEILQLTDLCVPNEIEVESLTGQAAQTWEQAEAAARCLLERGPEIVLVTLGERGCLIMERRTVERIPARAVTAVDTSGAGDAFIGALAVHLAEGRSLREAVLRANAGAALSVTRPGTQSSFPRRAEVEAFLAPCPQ